MSILDLFPQPNFDAELSDFVKINNTVKYLICELEFQMHKNIMYLNLEEFLLCKDGGH